MSFEIVPCALRNVRLEDLGEIPCFVALLGSRVLVRSPAP